MFPLANIKDSVLIIVMGVLLVISLLSVQSCNHYAAKAKDLKTQIKEDQLKAAAEIERYQRQAKEAELKAERKVREAYEKYAADIKAIQAIADANADLVNRMQHSTIETIKYLPQADRDTAAAIAATYGERLIEGAALLREVDAIAREYDAEIELTRAQCQANQVMPTDEDK